jgi:hypothetical protein
MAFKVINNFIGLNSLIPTLLVFRAYLCIMEFNTPNPTVVRQVVALKKAIEKVKKLKAKY